MTYNSRNKKISEFLGGAALTDSTKFSTVQSGVNKTFTRAQIASDLAAEFGASLRTYEFESEMVADSISLDEYAIVEENDYSLYKITNDAATGNNVALTSGLTATYIVSLQGGEYPDMATFLASSPADNINIATVESYPSWTPGVDEPKGGHSMYRTGANASAPTVDPGTPATPSTAGTGTRAGYRWTADGAEWYIPFSGKSRPEWFGGAPVGDVNSSDPEITGSEGVFDGGTDSGQALVDALTYLAANGGGELAVHSGLWKSSEQLTIDSNIIVRGEGKTNTMIRLAASANTDVFRTRGYSSFAGTDSWVVNTTGIPYGYGFVDICLDGNKDNNSSGYCYRGYGKMMILTGFMAKNAAEVGFYQAAGRSVGQSDYRDMPECLVDDVMVRGCDGEGFQWYGPHDTHLLRVISAFNGSSASDWNIRIGGDANTNGGCRAGRWHTYGGSGSGIIIEADTGVQGGHLIAENGIDCASTNFRPDRLQLGSANFGYMLRVTAGGFKCPLVDGETNTIAHNGVLITGDSFQIGTLAVAAITNGTGVLFDVDGNNGIVSNMSLNGGGGSGEIALRMGNSGAVSNTNIACGYVTGTETVLDYANAGSRNRVSFTANIDTNFITTNNASSTDLFDIIGFGAAATRYENDTNIQQTATNIADATATINTYGKLAGKRVYDQTNDRMLRARGSAATDPWDVMDGSTSVTPS